MPTLQLLTLVFCVQYCHGNWWGSTLARRYNNYSRRLILSPNLVHFIRQIFHSKDVKYLDSPHSRVPKSIINKRLLEILEDLQQTTSIPNSDEKLRLKEDLLNKIGQSEPADLADTVLAKDPWDLPGPPLNVEITDYVPFYPRTSW